MANEAVQGAYASFVLYCISQQNMLRCGRQERLKNLPKFEALFFAEGQRLPAAVRLAQPMD